MPPLGNVKAFGSTGYVQEFTDAANTSLKDALVTGAASLGGTNAVFQIMAPLYAYYSSVGAGTAGLPARRFAAVHGAGSLLPLGHFRQELRSVLVRDEPCRRAELQYQRNVLHGVDGARRLRDTRQPGNSATDRSRQRVAPATAGDNRVGADFARGAIYSTTSGTNRNKIFGVTQPIYDLYTAEQGAFGKAGAADQRRLPDYGRRVQAEFRRGRAAILGWGRSGRRAPGDHDPALRGAGWQARSR